ncbi:isochorismatase family protein [Marinactinospora thermotolerans]|uniref:Bifunctional isochorismate lyase / aryl carrier protein n=1 Tax=Marinactinospora thermotolerans DSM 45154 TaxID=1122192 RepID=A0A1T4NJA2_9ACTN|nr:isochorismatase family protein [Marinactinospora thermotolerans]SJZ79195.1 bifunctional isochorismate lyase / aryl carrier protein [Marinactinospora thermotolerans DSM 45154]
MTPRSGSDHSSALPGIAAYPMPAEDDIPAPRVGWSIDTDRCALLVHDMQNYFLNAFQRDAEPIPELTANIAALLEGSARHGVPRIYTVQPGSQEPARRGLLRDFWGEGLRDEAAHTSIPQELAPAPEDTVLAKHRYSAFARSDLQGVLRRMGRDQLVICGVYAHIGVLMTACDAFMRDIETFVVADAVADFSAEDHAMALSYAARRCAVPMSTRAALAALDG